jgi:hypothetical protein
MRSLGHSEIRGCWTTVHSTSTSTGHAVSGRLPEKDALGPTKRETRPRPAFGCLVRQPASSLRTSDIHRGTKGWGGPIPSPMLFTFARGDKVWTVRTRIVTATIGRSDHRGTYSHSRRSDISDTFSPVPVATYFRLNWPPLSPSRTVNSGGGQFSVSHLSKATHTCH